MPRSAGALIALVAVALLAPTAQAAGGGNYFTECESAKLAQSGILQTHRVRCSKGNGLVEGFMRKSSRRGVAYAKVRGFRCRNVSPALQPGIVCKRGGRVARYLGFPPSR